MSYIRLLVWTIVIIFSAIIIIQNTNQLIRLNFIVWESSKFEAVILFLLGILIGVLLSSPALIQQWMKLNKKYRQKLKTQTPGQIPDSNLQEEDKTKASSIPQTKKSFSLPFFRKSRPASNDLDRNKP